MSRFDILHFFGSEKMALPVGIAKLISRSNAKVFFTIYKINNSRQGLFRRLASMVLRKIDYFVVTTNYTKNKLIQLGVKTEKITVARPGITKNINTKCLANPSILKYKPFLLFWRNADQESGADICLEAFKNLSKKYKKVNFVFAIRSGCKYDSEILKTTKEYKNIHLFFFPYPGSLKIEDFLFSAEIVVLPFRNLSINPQMAILETMIAGAPIITSNIESNVEIIQDQRTGILIRPEADDLIRAIEKLLNNPAFAKRMGRDAKNSVQLKYNWQDYKRDLLRFYTDFSKYK